ncbi:hypothetical protein [Anthocerotibacter panamensis]|uniref:hypothetical protein n=1 Tax=Anthocerotibacter panamensis TaxID=2857077 RepID=UPI001C4066FB|nr:hypothetical protein [Anthocerotibacter panamensis]
MTDPIAPHRRDVLAGLVAAALASAAFARPRMPGWRAVQAMLDTLVRDRAASGICMGLTYGGATPVYPASGTISFDSATRFDENSLCRIYSMTKQALSS